MNEAAYLRPRPATFLKKVEALGFDVMQVYGLTETYGHVVQSIWHEEWKGLDFAERAKNQGASRRAVSDG